MRVRSRLVAIGAVVGAMVAGSTGVAMAATAPSAPQSPAVTSAVDGSFTIQWSAPASAGDSPIQTYAVQSASTVVGATQGSCSSPVSATSCVVSGLDNGIPYTFSITANNGLTSPAAVTASISSQGRPTRPLAVNLTPGDGYADASWTAPLSNGGGAVTQYNVTTSPSSAGCTTTGNPDLGCRIPGLTNGQQYTVTVTATNTYGTSAASDAVTVTPRQVPDSPLNVAATPGNTNAVITWDPPAWNGGVDVTGYRVTSTPASSTCVVGVTLPLRCELTGMTNGTSYTVSVYAINNAGDSVASDSVSVIPRTTPNSPANVVATAGDAQALVQWDTPANDGGSAIIGYRVTTSPASAGCQTVVADPNQCTLLSLANATSYDVLVVAYNVAGDSVYSSSVTVQPRTNPDAPINLVATPGNTVANVSWSTPVFDGGRAVTDYVVTASPGGATCSVTAPTTNCQLTGLTNGVNYTLSATATNSAGLVSVDSASTTVSPLTIPTAPLAVSAARGVNSAVVSWQAPADLGGRPVSLYTVTATPGGGTCTSLSTSCTVGNLTPGVDYSFTVVATNAAGDGPASAPAVVQQALNVPSAPRKVKASMAGTSKSKLGKVNVSWKASSNNGGTPILGYYARSGTAVCFTAKTSCQLTGLVSSPAKITVEAVNAVGSSARTATSSTVALTTISSTYINWRTQQFSGHGFQPNTELKILKRGSNGKYSVYRSFRYSSSGNWHVRVRVPYGTTNWKIQVSGYNTPRIAVSR